MVVLMNSPGGNNPSGGKTWPQSRIDHLEKLWQAGHTASQIASIMGGGLTKNAVLGAVHRNGFAKRASPIVKLTDEQRAARPRYRRPHPAAIVIEVSADGEQKRRGRPAQHALTTIRGGDPIRATLKAASASAERRAERPHYALTIHPASAPLPQPKPRTIDLRDNAPRTPWNGEPVTLELVGAGQCRWIVGNEGRGKDTLCCGAPTAPERSYCGGHCDKARGVNRVASEQALDHLAAVDQATGRAA